MGVDIDAIAAYNDMNAVCNPLMEKYNLFMPIIGFDDE